MEVVTRAIIYYFWSILLLRMMGKSLTFQQKPYDFVVMMIIGSASAALMINRDVPIFNGMVALLVLAILHTIISIASLNNTLKGIIGGQPDIIIRNGQIVKANMIKNQINLNQLLAGLRNQGYPRINDIEYAIMEANGQLSVIPKAQNRALQPQDLEVKTNYEGLAVALIMDGVLIKENIKDLGIDRNWLNQELSSRDLEIKDVFLAVLGTDSSLYIAEQSPINSFKAFFVGEGKD
ncbi:DUF421 domain-containing protein [Natronospora cellulosivora (SeqCode)]